MKVNWAITKELLYNLISFFMLSAGLCCGSEKKHQKLQIWSFLRDVSILFSEQECMNTTLYLNSEEKEK